MGRRLLSSRSCSKVHVTLEVQGGHALGCLAMGSRVGTCAEQLGLTNQVFDAALGQLAGPARGQACLIVQISQQDPPRYLHWTQVIQLGSWLICGPVGLRLRRMVAATTCKRRGLPNLVIGKIPNWMPTIRC